MERLQRTRLLSVAIVGVIFVSGVLLGLAFDTGLDDTVDVSSDPGGRTSMDSGSDEDRTRRVPMYRQVGELTPEQEAMIDSIMEIRRESVRELRQDFDEFRDRYNSRMAAISEGTREAIKGVLTPEQSMRYDSLVAEYQDSHRRDEGSQERRP